MNSKPDIEVEIAIELCRGTFKTEELLNFEKGTVLPFPTDIRSTVTLLCNEQVFATGDLVDVEGKFGVRIRDLV